MNTLHARLFKKHDVVEQSQMFFWGCGRRKIMPFPAQHQDIQPGLEYLMVPRPISVAPTYKSAGKLKGKVALVTGGDSGIGRAVCYHFALEGATVAFTYVDSVEEIDANETLEKLAEYKTADARNPMKIPVNDLGSDDTCKEVVDNVIAAYGCIDILVNNAGENHVVERIEDMKADQVERTFRTNIFSQFFIASHAVKHMKEGCNIINSLSRQAYLGMPTTLDYASSKGAILTFTRGLARQLAKRGIRVNDANVVVHLGEDTLMGRAGQPCEVAPCYVFLASEDASYMTGQILHPNGGAAMYS